MDNINKTIAAAIDKTTNIEKKTVLSCLKQIRSQLHNQAPLIHCITHPIVINDCANAVLALGGRPIMAEHPVEVADISASAAALTVSLGNITDARAESMFLAGKAIKPAIHLKQTAKQTQKQTDDRTVAHEKKASVIDLVGITCSPFRMELAKRFIKECEPAVIKGNGSEIRGIAGAAFHGTGVDVSAADAVIAKNPDTVHSMAHIARKLAEETGAVILVTGEVDIIASPDKDTTYGIYNGSPNMAKVTGTGCMLTCITGTYLAVTDALTACILAAVTLGCAGECANWKQGLGTYHIELINQLSIMNEDQIAQLSNIQRLL